MRPRSILGLIFAVGGIASVILGIAIDRRRRAFFATATRTDGRVVEMIRDPDDSSEESSMAPRVEFVDERGVKQSFVHEPYTYPAAYEVGERVRVAYSRDDPSRAKIDSTSSRHGPQLLTSGLGAVLLIAGVAMMRRRRR